MKTKPKSSQTCPQCKAPLELLSGQKPPSFCPHCRFPLMLVAGKYRLVKMLAQGGFGIIYLAHHMRLKRDRERVVKVLRPEVFTIEGMVARFRREVQLTAQLSQHNDHIVRIYDDFGEDDQLGPYYVMEYLQGQTLRELMDAGKMEQRLAFHIFAQICEAIGAGHREGVVHRDLKPENIYLIEREHDPHYVKLIDYGIAKPLTGTMVTRLTKSKDTLGTPAYMSPEQCLSQPVDARSDIYAMGGIFYEMLTGGTPFEQDKGHAFAFLYAHVSQPPLSMRSRRPELEIPEELDEAILKALAKDPNDRFQSAEDFAQTLAACAPPEMLPGAGPVMPSGDAHLAFSETSAFVQTGESQDSSVRDTRLGGKLTFDGVMYRHDLWHSGCFPGHGPDELTGVKWKFESRAGINASPAIVDDVLYVGSWDGYLYALEIETGAVRWKFRTGDQIRSSVSVVDGLVLFGSNDGGLYALDAESGECRWTFETAHWLSSSPSVIDGVVYCGGYDEKLFALDLEGGEVLWTFRTGSWVRSSPVVAGELLFCGSNDGHLYALDRKHGTLHWRFKAGAGVNSSPGLDGRYVYFGSGRLQGAGHFYALDGLSGRLRWKYKLHKGGATAPVVAQDVVYFCSNDGALYAVNARNGKKRWRHKTKRQVLSSPSLGADVVYFGGLDGGLYAVDAQEGALKWRFQAGGRISSSPVIGDGVVYFGCQDGYLYALH